MEKHKCKLCFRSFFNGRALGGHMRSHMMNLHIPSEPEESPFLHHRARRREEEAATVPSEMTSSTSSSEGEAEEDDLCYARFSFPVDAASVILQDRESETESSKNPTSRRLKRKSTGANRYFNEKKIRNCSDFDEESLEKVRLRNLTHSELWTESERISSISDSSTEEDVAFCLMMLSRDDWKKRLIESEEEEEMETDSEELKCPKIQNRGKFQCETCNKIFRSYQALGGHRASHKKMKVSSSPSMADKRIHECAVCLKVFSSGQALGGHKRSHVTGLSPLISSTPSTTKLNLNLIDLNLPAPIDEDDVSQIDLSAVPDADFVKPIRM